MMAALHRGNPARRRQRPRAHSTAAVPCGRPARQDFPRHGAAANRVLEAVNERAGPPACGARPSASSASSTASACGSGHRGGLAIPARGGCPARFPWPRAAPWPIAPVRQRRDRCPTASHTAAAHRPPLLPDVGVAARGPSGRAASHPLPGRRGRDLRRSRRTGRAGRILSRPSRPCLARVRLTGRVQRGPDEPARSPRGPGLHLFVAAAPGGREAPRRCLCPPRRGRSCRPGCAVDGPDRVPSSQRHSCALSGVRGSAGLPWPACLPLDHCVRLVLSNPEPLGRLIATGNWILSCRHPPLNGAEGRSRSWFGRRRGVLFIGWVLRAACPVLRVRSYPAPLDAR